MTALALGAERAFVRIVLFVTSDAFMRCFTILNAGLMAFLTHDFRPAMCAFQHEIGLIVVEVFFVDE